MSIKPIDFKTSLYNSDDASRVRENQKIHEVGAAGNVIQNKNEADKKTETIQKTEESEGLIIKKEDEENKKNKQEKKEAEKKEKIEEEKAQKPKIPDGIHFKIDFRA